MNQKGAAFFSVVILALALMVLIVVTQFFTNKSTTALTIGNRQAVETFLLNNSIQALVNTSFDLEGKFKNPDIISDKNRMQPLADSLSLMLGYHAYVIVSKALPEGQNIAEVINNIVDSQVYISEKIIQASKSADNSQLRIMTDSLEALRPGERVYENCLKLQKVLQTNLQQTLDKNSDQAGKLSFFNRILAIFSIIAILVLATIIIRRQSQQLKLIVELKAAELAALKSKNAKDEFLANMSHELRTPLNALIGFGKLLDTTDLNSQQKEYVEIIKSSGYNLLHIVNDVLDLSKIEAGKLTVAHRPFNLYDLFARTEKMFSATIREKGLRYQYFIDQQVPQHVIGDPDRLQQIFINLISNAIKFTTEGGIDISAGVVWIDEEQKYYKLSFTIRDTGIGIPKDKVASIFERFEQLEHGAQRQHGGTGLGLTIVKNLVERMGGSISVYSHVNEGSEFNFTCVLEKLMVVEETPREVREEDFSFKGFNVLVVEDNRANQVLIRHIFNKHQLYPKIIDNGQKAVDILRKESFDLVFMDIQMPVMDGYTAITILRNELYLNTPVIAMTAYVSEGEVKKCLEAGFSDYMAKPLDEDLLVQKMTFYLHNVEIPERTLEEANHNKGLSFLKTVVGDNPEMLAEIINEMRLQWDQDKKDLISLSKKNDRDSIHRVLHRMKSTFLSLGPNHSVYKVLSEKGSILTEDLSKLPDNCIRLIDEIDGLLNNTLENVIKQ